MKREYFVRILLFALVYLISTKLGLLIALGDGFATLVWPGTGLALSLLLIYGIKIWPAITIGAFSVNLIQGGSVEIASAMCVGNTLEALAIYSIINYFGDVPSLFIKLKNTINFIFASFIGSVISAVIGGTTAVIFCKGEFDLIETVGTWWLGDVTSCLLIVPCAMLFSKSSLKELLNKKTYVSFFLLLSLSFLTFFYNYNSEVISRVLIYSLFIFPLWASLAQNRLSGILHVLIISSFAIGGTISGMGPFILPDLNNSLLLLQSYTSILVITTLIVSVGIKEKKLIETKLSDSLKEKELLVSEIHHRVKNNLSVVSSLLYLEGEKMENLDERKRLDNIVLKVKTIALVHEKLYKKSTINTVEFSDYIKNLAEMIQSVHQQSHVAIKLDFDLEELDLKIEKAVPLGLILNELLTNSFKHAFHGRSNGEIGIEFKYKENKYFIRINDNGIGYKTENVIKNNSLGLTLVDALKKQINADLSVKVDSGTSYEFYFN